MFSSTIQLGEPVVHRGILIAPLFPRRQPRTDYITLEEAIPLGFRVTEVDAAGSVPELLAHNPLDSNVLLYDGEELVGAKQNRILNVTVLVPAQSETRLPVSCVEEGRWSARTAAFAAAKRTDWFCASASDSHWQAWIFNRTPKPLLPTKNHAFAPRRRILMPNIRGLLSLSWRSATATAPLSGAPLCWYHRTRQLDVKWTTSSGSPELGVARMLLRSLTASGRGPDSNRA